MCAGEDNKKSPIFRQGSVDEEKEEEEEKEKVCTASVFWLWDHALRDARLVIWLEKEETGAGLS